MRNTLDALIVVSDSCGWMGLCYSIAHKNHTKRFDSSSPDNSCIDWSGFALIWHAKEAAREPTIETGETKAIRRKEGKERKKKRSRPIPRVCMLMGAAWMGQNDDTNVRQRSKWAILSRSLALCSNFPNRERQTVFSRRVTLSLFTTGEKFWEKQTKQTNK